MERHTLSDFDINDFNDQQVWKYICSGRTKGVFQLESNLGRHWAKQLQPSSILELAALISVIRPGTLMAKVDGKSMTQHYCDRKAGKDPVVYQHESLESILSETYGVLVYQEQSMMIAQKLAGFDLKEADKLRKAIGKKKADLMEQVKGEFLKGAEKVGMVTREIAEEIFNGIEKSNRYAFNKSHRKMNCSVGCMLAFGLTHNLNLNLGGTLRFLKLSFHPLKFYGKPLPFLSKRVYRLLRLRILPIGQNHSLTR